MIEKIKIMDYTKGFFEDTRIALTKEGFTLTLTEKEYQHLLKQEILNRPLEIEREIASISIRNNRYYVQYVEGEVAITKSKYNELYEALSEVQTQTK